MEHPRARGASGPVSKTRFRVPDVVVWSRDEPKEQILTRPPIAVFEVLSPEDRMSRMVVKLEDYVRMGIGTVRVIDPDAEVVYRYADGELVPLTEEVETLQGSRGLLDWAKVRKSLVD